MALVGAEKFSVIYIRITLHWLVALLPLAYCIQDIT